MGTASPWWDEQEDIGTPGEQLRPGLRAGILISDLILGRENPWQKLYDPRRSSLRAVGRLVTEAANPFGRVLNGPAVSGLGES